MPSGQKGPWRSRHGRRHTAGPGPRLRRHRSRQNARHRLWRDRHRGCAEKKPIGSPGRRRYRQRPRDSRSRRFPRQSRGRGDVRAGPWGFGVARRSASPAALTCPAASQRRASATAIGGGLLIDRLEQGFRVAQPRAGLAVGPQQPPQPFERRARRFARQAIDDETAHGVQIAQPRLARFCAMTFFWLAAVGLAMAAISGRAPASPRPPAGRRRRCGRQACPWNGRSPTGKR